MHTLPCLSLKKASKSLQHFYVFLVTHQVKFIVIIIIIIIIITFIYEKVNIRLIYKYKALIHIIYILLNPKIFNPTIMALVQ